MGILGLLALGIFAVYKRHGNKRSRINEERKSFQSGMKKIILSLSISSYALNYSRYIILP